MPNRYLLTAAVLIVLVAALPVEAAKAGAGRAPVTGGTGTGTSGYVPPVVEEHGAVRIHLVGLLHDGKQLPGGRHFSTRTLRDLIIAVEYRDLPAGPHTQRLKLFAPDGALYQQFTREYAVNGQATRSQSRRGAGWQPVETRLPVGGTWITEHSLYGSWRLEVYLDSASQPTVSHPFTLTK